MKFRFLLLIAALSISSFAHADRVATLQTDDGETAYLVSEKIPHPTATEVSFGLLTVEINGRTYRIGNNSSNTVFDLLCVSYRSELPYDYNTVESIDSGFLGLGGEKVVEISNDRIVTLSDAEVVIQNGWCQKEMY